MPTLTRFHKNKRPVIYSLRKNASKVLQTFACDKQVIVLTCHPTNAKLLGGNLINL